MRVLQLTVKPPYPAVDGGCIAIKNFSEMILDGGHRLKILSLATHKHPFLPEEIPAAFHNATEIEGIYINTEVNIIDAFSSLVTFDSYNISRFFSTDFDARLEEVLLANEFDVIQLESLFMAPYISTIRRLTAAKIVLRSHNFEHSIWEQIAARESSRLKRWYLNYLASQLRKFEINNIEDVDGVIAISTSDEKRYKELQPTIPVTCIPFGLNTNQYKASPSANKVPQVFHIGAMDWQPNIDGIQWFLSKVWSELAPQVKETSLHLAGRNMDIASYQNLAPQTELHGEVANAQAFMQNHDIMVVPLHSGAGIRIKILEGMAMGKTVVSTTVGAEGISAEHGEEIFIANTEEEFIQTLTDLILNPERVAAVGRNARSFALHNFSKETLQKRYDSFCQELLAIA